jgi:hypothetical protein
MRANSFSTTQRGDLRQIPSMRDKMSAQSLSELQLVKEMRARFDAGVVDDVSMNLQGWSPEGDRAGGTNSKGTA